MRRILLLLALLAAAPACRPADAATYGRQIGAAPSSFSGAVAFNGVSTFNAEVNVTGVADLSASGVVLSVPLTLPATQQGVAAQYTTALLDLTATADNISLSIPQRSGYIFCPRLLTVLVHDGSGTATGSLIWSAGNNASHNNTASMTVSAATINATVPVAPQPAFANGGGASPLLDSATQIVAKISTAVTGVASLHGYLSISGFWVPS